MTKVFKVGAILEPSDTYDYILMTLVAENGEAWICHADVTNVMRRHENIEMEIKDARPDFEKQGWFQACYIGILPTVISDAVWKHPDPRD